MPPQGANLSQAVTLIVSTTQGFSQGWTLQSVIPTNLELQLGTDYVFFLDDSPGLSLFGLPLDEPYGAP